MSSIHNFAPGDFLIFQLEAGFGLLRVLDVVDDDGDHIWHVRAYRDLFLDADMADRALDQFDALTVEIPHVAQTNRAFESTQVAKMRNVPLTDDERVAYDMWRSTSDRHVSDRSIRLLLGLR